MKLIATAFLVLTLVVPAPAAATAAPSGATAVVTTATVTRTLTIKDGVSPRKKVRTTATTVGGLLAEQGITLGEFDRVKPSLATRLKKGMKVRIYRVSVTSETVLAEVVPFSTVIRKNPTLKRGVRHILVAGQPGSSDRTYKVTTVNGKVKSRQLVGEVVLVAPVVQVVEVGTKGPKLNLKHLKMWNRIAKCESGGRWHINTHNGYYGGLQFNLATWRSVHGRDFASYPHKASKAEQITVANRLYAKRGTRPWGGCA